MKRLILTLGVFALLIAPSGAMATNWNIDPDHSAAHFKVRHMMIADVRGSFPDVQGVVVINDSDITRSTVDVTIKAASIHTGVEKRDAHLKSADFFEVETYPTLTFKSKRVQKVSDNSLRVVGDLTLHGVTKEVELLVDGPSGEVKDPWGNLRKGARAATQINRKDFGIIWNATLDNGGLMIGDDVEIIIDLEFIKQAN
ncbi:YceI family protein [Desulfuromonas sp. AOP6]|uniref:YceI family protein n=1 Tax=Desulfuromonas sp. AOP6 TaxID=1566351 RepID=UPI001289A46E|nr:YceI family protein [Desulfuromonas sp. AOP6]BCA79005.1 polyisoprenoid-binding protein [Desulfuromonas sp. AOP6]